MLNKQATITAGRLTFTYMLDRVWHQDPRNWMQGKFTDHHGRYCLTGAANAAFKLVCEDLELNEEQKLKVTGLLTACVTHEQRMIRRWSVTWNDKPGRTAEEVFELVREMIRYVDSWRGDSCPTVEDLMIQCEAEYKEPALND